MDVSGDYAYIAGGGGGLYIVDISNPNSPWIVSSADTPGYAYDVRVTGNTAFVADGSAGLQIIDVTDPEAPANIGSIDTPGDAQDVVVSGTNAFTAGGSIGLQIVNINNLTSPVITGAYATAVPAKGVDVSGNMAVVAEGFNGVAISAGGYHTVALKSDGTVWTWGYNYSNQFDHHPGSDIGSWNTPYPVDGLSGAHQPLRVGNILW